MNYVKEHKILSSIVSLCLVMVIGVASAIVINNNNDKIEKEPESVSQEVISTESSEESAVTSSEEVISSEVISSQPITSSKVESVASKPTVSQNTVTKKPAATKKPTAVTNTVTSYNYNTNVDIDNNIFLDSLVYTGYNLKKHRADGLMWQYVLASQKRGKGWLSKIGYAGGSTGYETYKGKPDIKKFEKSGLVCASYVTYVYFNYLPNVAGIDTSSLTKPKKSYSANDWYLAASDWVKKGYSKSVKFKASKTSSGFINFKLNEDIPIGSIMAFSDAKKPGSKHCSHVAIYAGYKNGYHWVFHVGNDNGPEFCAVERMHFGPDPQWPLAVITTPSNIRMSALLEVSVKSADGKALSGVKINLKNNKTGKITYLGATNGKGILITQNLAYGDYTVVQTVPTGYTCAKPSCAVKLTTANNSYNKVSFVDALIPPPESEPESSSSEQVSSGDSSQTSSSEESSGDSSSTTQSDNTTTAP